MHGLPHTPLVGQRWKGAGGGEEEKHIKIPRSLQRTKRRRKQRRTHPGQQFLSPACSKFRVRTKRDMACFLGRYPAPEGISSQASSPATLSAPWLEGGGNKQGQRRIWLLLLSELFIHCIYILPSCRVLLSLPLSWAAQS